MSTLDALEIFNEELYLGVTEILDQKINLFNAASRGTIVLQQLGGPSQGDYQKKAFWAKIQGLVKRRDPTGSAPQSSKDLSQFLDVSVKVAAGMPPINIDPSRMKWIARNPEEQAAIVSQQLAPEMLADQLNTGLLSLDAGLSQIATLNTDKTGASPDTLTHGYLNEAVSKFGDRATAIVAWVAHSKPLFDLFGQNLVNAEQLFSFGTVNVSSDAFGRVFVISDSPALVTTGAPDVFNVLGLVPNALLIQNNGDFINNFDTSNGDENINRTMQAEWSYNVGLKGFAWDIANGGPHPDDAALATAGNWDKVATSDKDLPGVRLLVN